MHDDTSPIRFNPGKGGYYRDDSRTKPSGSAGGKDFGAIMSKDEREGKSSSGKKQIKTDDEGSEDHIDDIAMLEEEAAVQGPVSLFDMSKTLASKKQKPFVKASKESSSLDPQALANEKEALSPASMMGKQKTKSTTHQDDIGDDVAIEPEHIGSAEQLPKKADLPARPFDLIASATHEIAAHTEKTPSQKGKSAAQFSREQPDLAAVNPLAALQPNANINLNLDMTAEKPIAPVKSIQELINLMVKEVQSMEAEGKTDTTITLKHPPIFEGAQLVVSSFSSARGEFNISFENLTQAAQQLINMQDNQASLLNSLEQKGYHVHILTATTLDEQRLFTSNVDDTRRERDQNREDEQGGRRNQNQEGTS